MHRAVDNLLRHWKSLPRTRRSAVIALWVTVPIFCVLRLLARDMLGDDWLSDLMRKYDSHESFEEWTAKKAGNSVVAKELGGDDVLRGLARPRQGMAYRVNGVEFPDLTTTPVRSGPVAIHPDVLRRISATFGQEASYSPYWVPNADGSIRRRRAIGCDPYYSIRFHIVDDASRELDIFISYECAFLVIFLNGTAVGEGVFWPIQADAIAIARGLFPEDPWLERVEQDVLRLRPK